MFFHKEQVEVHGDTKIVIWDEKSGQLFLLNLVDAAKVEDIIKAPGWVPLIFVPNLSSLLLYQYKLAKLNTFPAILDRAN